VPGTHADQESVPHRGGLDVAWHCRRHDGWRRNLHTPHEAMAFAEAVETGLTSLGNCVLFKVTTLVTERSRGAKPQ
jgi:hypothetical protein